MPDALEQTPHARHPHNDDTLTRRSDCGGQHVSIRYTEHMAAVDVEPSVGRLGDSHLSFVMPPSG